MTKPKDLISACLMPLLYANMAGMVAGAVWLGVTSQWHVIWIGVMMLFFAPYLLPVLMIPAGVFSHYMVFYHNAGQRGKERAMYAASIGYIILFVSVFCTAIFNYVTKNVSPAALGAGMLWGAASALMPLLMWSSKDVGNVFVTTVVISAQVALLLLAALIFYTGAIPLWMSITIFGCCVALLTIARIVHEEKK